MNNPLLVFLLIFLMVGLIWKYTPSTKPVPNGSLKNVPNGGRFKLKNTFKHSTPGVEGSYVRVVKTFKTPSTTLVTVDIEGVAKFVGPIMVDIKFLEEVN